MQKHCKNYMKYFGYGEQDKILCEHCGRVACDLHHIVYRSHGGTDEVENIIALCRKCHEMAHNSELTQGDLKLLHARKMGATTGVMGKNLWKMKKKLEKAIQEVYAANDRILKLINKSPAGKQKQLYAEYYDFLMDYKRKYIDGEYE